MGRSSSRYDRVATIRVTTRTTMRWAKSRRPSRASSRMTRMGQCQRYTPYEMTPRRRRGGHSSTRRIHGVAGPPTMTMPAASATRVKPPRYIQVTFSDAVAETATNTATDSSAAADVRRDPATGTPRNVAPRAAPMRSACARVSAPKYRRSSELPLKFAMIIQRALAAPRTTDPTITHRRVDRRVAVNAAASAIAPARMT